MIYLKIPELKDGYTYRVSARNASFGIWRKSKNSFIISRWKFGANYIFEEYHYDTGAPFGTVNPLEEIEKSPFVPEKDTEKIFTDTHFYIEKEDEILEYLNKFEEEESWHGKK